MSDFVIEVSDKAAVHSQTSSKGNQKKWFSGQKWIKADELGYEGLSEIICSRLADELKFPYGTVKYHPCIISDITRGKKMTGCFSEPFIGNYEEITLGRLMKKFLGTEPAEFFDSSMAAEEKADYVVSEISKITGLEDVGRYLSDLFRFDRMVLNEDRHYHNIIFLYDRSRFYFAPMFDCGAALLSDLYGDYPAATPVSICARNVKAKPFSKSFSKQCEIFSSKYGNSFDFSSAKIKISDLYGYYDEQIIKRACSVLSYQYSLNAPGKVIDFV